MMCLCGHQARVDSYARACVCLSLPMFVCVQSVRVFVLCEKTTTYNMHRAISGSRRPQTQTADNPASVVMSNRLAGISRCAIRCAIGDAAVFAHC